MTVGKKEIFNEGMERLRDTLKEYPTCDDKENHYVVRYHRCYIGGDYGNYKESGMGDAFDGEKLYNMYVGQVNRKNKDTTLRKIAISSLASFIAIEFFQRTRIPSIQEVEDTLTITLKEHKEEFIGQLIDNLKGLIE